MREDRPDLAKARDEGAAQIIKQQLRCQFGKLPPEVEQRLDQAEFLQLQAWAESLLQATQLDDIFNDSGLSRTLKIESKEYGLHLLARRIGDQRYRSLARGGLGIEPNYSFWHQLARHSADKDESWGNLAKFYASFRQAYGESGNHYDHWKGAFNFAFEIQILKEAEMIPYVLNILNFRSGVEFRYYKIIPSEETRYDPRIMYAPFAEEFSMKQMNIVSAYLCGFAEGYWQTSGGQHSGQEFLKCVESNLILFGCHGGVYFEENFEDSETFEAAKANWQQLLQSTAVPPPPA
jgi:hypothetical protein